ncbi:hypothetical protein SB767_31465, partial [Bacillus sp. SIMBA_069]
MSEVPVADVPMAPVVPPAPAVPVVPVETQPVSSLPPQEPTPAIPVWDLNDNAPVTRLVPGGRRAAQQAAAVEG